MILYLGVGASLTAAIIISPSPLSAEVDSLIHVALGAAALGFLACAIEIILSVARRQIDGPAPRKQSDRAPPSSSSSFSWSERASPPPPRPARESDRKRAC
jgi:hypothetical protein